MAASTSGPKAAGYRRQVVKTSAKKRQWGAVYDRAVHSNSSQAAFPDIERPLFSTPPKQLIYIFRGIVKGSEASKE
jgi:hypothetical protein